MPRHPPCALHSLSQQRQDNTQKTHQPTPQSKEQASTQKRHDQPRNSQSCLRNYIHQHTPRNTHVKHALTDQLQDARVHYADLKQQPHQHPPHPPRPSPQEQTQGTTRTHRHEEQREDQKQPTTPTRKRRHPNWGSPTRERGPADPSGPNSVLDPIPHQRRAMSNQTTHTRQAGTNDLTIDDSTSEHHHACQNIRLASGRVLLSTCLQSF